MLLLSSDNHTSFFLKKKNILFGSLYPATAKATKREAKPATIGNLRQSGTSNTNLQATARPIQWALLTTHQRRQVRKLLYQALRLFSLFMLYVRVVLS